MIVVAKIGTSSLTDGAGHIDGAAVAKLCADVAEVRAAGHQAVVVTSGAIAAGQPALGLDGRRPTKLTTLQAISAVGQSRLMRVYDEALAAQGLVGGQVLLSPLDFANHSQYGRAGKTMRRLLELGVVPVVNENDAVADDEIRMGDNDRLAALVAQLVGAEVLVLLTDTAGLHTADPRLVADASLIEEIVQVDRALLAVAGRPGTARGSGGMATKLAAARMAAWSGVRTVIAAAARPGVLAAAAAGEPGVGTVVRAHDRRLPVRKLWIGFGIGSSGTLRIDDGARRALVERHTSLLPAGVVGVEGDFDVDDAVEIAGTDGRVVAKGLVRHSSARLAEWCGRRTAELPPDVPHEVVHRDDLVIL